MLLLLYSIVVYFLIAVDIAFLIRVILSFIVRDAEGPLVVITIFLTELFVAPIRIFFEKRGWFTDQPVDVAFFFGSILVTALLLILI